MKKIGRLGCLMVTSCAFGSLSDVDRAQCREWIAQGKAEADQRHFVEAEGWYAKAHEVMEAADDFGDGLLLLREGDLLRKWGRKEDAYELYESAIARGNDRVGAEALGKMSLLGEKAPLEREKVLKHSFVEIQGKENKANLHKAECFDHLVDALRLYKGDQKKEALGAACGAATEYCKSLWHGGVAKKMKIENAFDALFSSKEEDQAKDAR